MLIEAVELGAAAHFKVEGNWNADLMKQVRPPHAIVEEVSTIKEKQIVGKGSSCAISLRWRQQRRPR